jgi:septal ring factor EnvC (AmiA/AmiB activator)
LRYPRGYLEEKVGGFVTEMSVDEVRAIRWVEWILAPLLVVSVLTLGNCTAKAQDELIVLQRDVSEITKVNGETKTAIKQIERDANTTKVSIGKISSDVQHNKEQIDKIQRTVEETNRLLRGLTPR